MQKLQITEPRARTNGHAPLLDGKTEEQEHADVLHILNHDLKAGLRALAELPTWVDEDLKDYGIVLPSDIQDHLDMMHRSARDLMGVLDGLVDLSNAGRSPDEPKRTTVEQAARHAWEMVNPDAKFKLDTSDALDTIFLPKRAVATVFKSLLENTVHHHDRDAGLITVVSETKADRVCITIEDDGPGIPRGARREVLDPLVMMRRREETGRAGLGLTVARKLVSKMSGTMTLTEASNGRGTAVVFDLPIRARW